MLTNYKNYGPLLPLIQTGKLTINTNEITNDTWDDYYISIINIMKDGIETDFVHRTKINIVFGDTGVKCRLTITDLLFNVIMWYLIIRLGEKIMPNHLFFDYAITKDTIKKFIDTNFIIPHRTVVSFKHMNNLIDDTLHSFMDIDHFSAYLASTVNLEDFISLMNASPEFDKLMHIDLSDVPLEDVKNVGMEMTNRGVEIIESSKKLLGFEHCLADSLRAREGTNIKQLKEFAFNIGTKPDGKGGAHPIAINSSYLNGGLNQLAYQFIDSAASRYAQIITKDKVGDSGKFARIVGLNSTDSFLHDDPEYDCHTKNLLELTITSKEFLKLYRDRWYRFYPDGPEYLCKGNEKELIGKTLYFRSPEKCASEARGHGICFKCYGPLAYTNRGIKPGKMAAELITNKTTQMRLSAKHLLETMIKKFYWNENFRRFIEVDGITLTLNKELEFNNKWFVLIDPEDIVLENEVDYKKTIDTDEDEAEENEEDTNYNEYVTKFYIGQEGSNELFEIGGESEEYKMYISNSLNALIRSNGIPTSDKKVKLLFSDIEDMSMFFIRIENDDIGKSLKDIEGLMDNKKVTSLHNAESLTQGIIEAAIEGKLGIQAIHYEVLIMNQIRSIHSNLQKPDWDIPNVPYTILTLKKALFDHPSVTVSLLYQNLGLALYYPLTFKKTKPSFMDLFFMQRPQNFFSDTSNIVNTTKKPEKIVAIRRVRERE